MEFLKNRKTETGISKLQVLPCGVSLFQAEGSEFTTDSLLLSESIRISPGAGIAELGCGTGGVTFSAAKNNPECIWLGIDIQEKLLKLALKSAALQELKIDFTALCCSVENVPRLIQGNSFDAVMTNPPFNISGSGRQSPIPSRKKSRSGSSLLIYQFVRAAGHLLKPGGIFAIVGTPEMVPKILLGCETYNLRLVESGDVMQFEKPTD